MNKILSDINNKTSNNWEIYPISKNMIFGITLGIILMVLVFTLIISLSIFFALRQRRKDTLGFKFEENVNRLLENYAANSNYKFIKGSKFSYGGEQQFEIDGLLYCDKFIIIVESKYFQGNIEGDSNNRFIYVVNDNKKAKFANPLHQNLRHIEHFNKMCGFKIPTFSLLFLPTQANYNLQGKQEWSIVVNTDNFETILNDVYNQLSSSPSIDTDKIKNMLEIIKVNKVKSLKEIKKWEQGLKQNE
ncbi:Nuclease-related domain [Mycoplasmopsis bovigenitalium]|uniref:Nuclease-related domain n=1 Tax=Mycoplasmopsis bovigenitalium TaxID=2112 RepID=A0A449A8V8_9BACT|nr:nuclease-related domain-containing protein [Mycoplasmopsis bovigenitalium]VEU60622.1 Nuclease-related domain [Mycoplasmopsis bovigenitalium]